MNSRTQFLVTSTRSTLAICCALFLAPFPLNSVFAQKLPAEKVAFFESRIRPILVEACYECHNSGGKAEGGLAVDSREGLLKGGDRGPALIPGNAKESLMVQAMRHDEEDLRMPQGGPKLKGEVVADFSRWIEDGAIDPRDKPPSAEELSQETSWEKTRDRRKQWWSFQPVKLVEPPPVDDARWNEHPIDRFLHDAQQEAGVAHAEPAEPATLLRRVTLLITGLPPTEAEMRAFVADPSPRAYRAVVDRLLASPRFGERWARHWMDWMRFAESHGSEGDPAIPHAWQYRDYLIRALNADVPYDQLVREHIAGDLLPHPRIDQAKGIRESAFGIGHFRMVPHGFAPTDAYDEQIRFTDNQIDVVSKAFLGITVACARCHNHKFDPISQKDFYAWYGIFASCRPGVVAVDTPDRARTHQAELTRLKAKLKSELAAAWNKSSDSFAKQLQERSFEAEAKDVLHPLHIWESLRKLPEDQWAPQWEKLSQERAKFEVEFQRVRETSYPLHWKLDRAADYDSWFKSGNGLPEKPAVAGEFSIEPQGSESVVANLFPAGVYTHGLSTKHNGVLQSPRFKINCDEIWVRVAGGSNARVRYVVQNYPRVVLIYPHSQIESETAKWLHWDARYWKGENAYIELVTGDDQPLDVGSKEGRSWFGITEVIGRNLDQPAPMEPLGGLWSVLPQKSRADPPRTFEDLKQLYRAAMEASLSAWQEGKQTDAQAEFLGYLVRAKLLPNTIAALQDSVPSLTEYRRLESEIPLPVRAPGIHEGTPFDQPLLDRGDHKKPLAEVPRGFLEVFDPQPFVTRDSGRLQLAEKLSDGKNPLVPRVIVNRLWHHLFGTGLVATTDNLGRLGDEPTHPELLDYLATHFAGLSPDEGNRPLQPWSIKDFVRFVVLSQAFQQSSRSSESSLAKDPENQLLGRFPIRRLEAEAIRDSLLAVATGLDEMVGGPSVGGNSRRRSVYVRVQRNSLDPLLATFDAPEPALTRGRRDATNVPAQSLALLNDPFVIDLAKTWSQRVRQDPQLTSDEERVKFMLTAAVAREPSAAEIQLALKFVESAKADQASVAKLVEAKQLEISKLRQQVSDLLEPARQKLLAKRGKTAMGKAADFPQPLARWTFDGDLRDAIGSLHAELRGPKSNGSDAAALKPFFQDGALLLDGQHYAVTPLIEQALAPKTLEVWVQLDNLDQKGGAAISLEAPDGSVFDALVFGERDPRQWLAGSDFFKRTQALDGEAETVTDRPVHVALTYAADGTISMYRDGKEYGKPYVSKALLNHSEKRAHLLFGLRHSPAANGRFLTGRLFEARLYDRALTGAEIAKTSQADGFVSEVEVLAALSAEERTAVAQAEKEMQRLAAEIGKLAPSSTQDDPNRPWQDLAQSLFSWKEFLYLY